MNKIIKEKFYNFAVSDFDGTIFNSRKEVSAATVSAINQFIDNGGTFCVCTGRMTGAIINLLKYYGIDRGYVITYNGAEICNIATGEKVFKAHIDSESVVKIMRFAELNNLEVLIYPEDRILIEKITPGNVKYMNMSGSSALVVAKKVSDYVAERSLTTGKCLFLTGGNEENTRKITSELPAIIGDGFNVVRSNPYHVDIMRKGVSKVKRLNYLQLCLI
jgi:Cof subfamily protein (haloacid dehalogenase superfamily)